MKLICERDALRSALSHVASRARNKSKIPILQHALLDAATNKIMLTATDLDTRCVASCPAEVAEASSTTVHADRLSRIVDGMPPGAQITLFVKGHDLHIECGRSRYKLPTLPASDFPDWSGADGGFEIVVSADDAKRIFADTATALPANDSRLYFFGGCLAPAKGGIKVTGCDGVRLVCAVIESEAKPERGYIIPKPTMPELVKLAAEGDLRIRLNDRLIEVTSGNVVFSSRLIEADYPDTARVIPELTEAFIEVDRKEYVAAFKRLTGVENDDSTIKIRWNQDEAAVGMSLVGDGSGEESVPCKCTAPSGEIAFKPNILGGMLDVMKGRLLQLYPTTPEAPMRIADPDDPSLTVVAMPCRAKN